MTTKPTTYLLFTYGTLLPNEPRHHILTEGNARRLGPATTGPGYALLDLGAFPALVHRPRTRLMAEEGAGLGQVVGELYEIDQPLLDYLDYIEGHPRFYRREPVAIDADTAPLMAGSQVIIDMAISYFGNEATESGPYPVIKSGDWRNR